jgi:hypothetical protein
LLKSYQHNFVTKKIKPMAKITKTTDAKPAVKKAAAKPAAASKTVSIEDISKTILEKLKAASLSPELQSEMEWCLGSYSHDKNPVGLFETSAKALPILKEALTKKTKGITAKLIGDVEKALNA